MCVGRRTPRLKAWEYVSRAYQLGRKFLGIEGNPEYVEIFNEEFVRVKAGLEPRTEEEVRKAGGQFSILD